MFPKLVWPERASGVSISDNLAKCWRGKDKVGVAPAYTSHSTFSTHARRPFMGEARPTRRGDGTVALVRTSACSDRTGRRGQAGCRVCSIYRASRDTSGGLWAPVGHQARLAGDDFADEPEWRLRVTGFSADHDSTVDQYLPN